MKRFLALALAAVLVLGFAATAMAAHLEVTGNGTGLKFNGEYRFRAVSQNNVEDLDDNTPDRVNLMNQRVRFIITSQVGEGVDVVTRLTLSNGSFDGASATGGAGAVSTDWAYLQAKKFGGTWFIGRQPASWGHGFHAKGAIVDRVKYVAKINDQVTVGAVLQKNNETSSLGSRTAPSVGNGGGGDSDTYYVLAVIKPVEGHTVGIILNETNDNDDTLDNDGSWFDIYYGGKIGPVGVAAEFSSVSSDVPNSDKSGFFVLGMMDVNDMISVSLAYAQANDGFIADDDFAPTLLAGREANATAIIDFGETASGQDNKAIGIVLGANFKVSDDLTLGAKFAQHTLDDLAEVDMTEIDLSADYKIAANTMLTAGYAIGQVDVTGASPDDITSAALQIKTTW